MRLKTTSRRKTSKNTIIAEKYLGLYVSTKRIVSMKDYLGDRNVKSS
jgi:hypothetical protein